MLFNITFDSNIIYNQLLYFGNIQMRWILVMTQFYLFFFFNCYRTSLKEQKKKHKSLEIKMYF